MDLHLDDRLLHGRILHGWLPALRPARLVLVAAGLGADGRAAEFAAALAELALPLLCCDPQRAAPPPAPAAGDFWLTDAPAHCDWLRAQGLPVARLVIIGLRDQGGAALAPDFAPAAESRRRLLALAAAGLPCLLQRFPSEPTRAAADLLDPGVPEP